MLPFLPLMQRLGRRGFVWLLAGTSVLASACLSSPTLPLPPPGDPDIERLQQGIYELSGEIPRPARVEALNLRTNLLYGMETDRFYRFRVEAEPGDYLRLWYRQGNETSEFVEFVLDPDGTFTEAGADSGELLE